MDEQYILITACCVSAFVTVFLVSFVTAGYFDAQKRAFQIVQRTGVQRNTLILQDGIPFLRKIAQNLLSYKPVQAYSSKLHVVARQHELASSQEGLLSCLGGFVLVIALLSALGGRAELGILACTCLVAFLGAYCNRALEQRKELMRDELPEALQSMGSCFGAGYSLVQTFSHLEKEVKPPLGAVFGEAARSLQTGVGVQPTLNNIRLYSGMNELAFISVALAVQHQTGGSLQRVLDATRESLKEELDLKRSLRVHTAQAKLSARVVVGVTIGLMGAMMLLSRDFLTPFLSSVAGLLLLSIALIMQVAGIFIVRSLLRLEVD